MALINGSGIVVGQRGSSNLDKLTWQMSSRNKMVFEVTADPIRTTNLGIDSGTDPQSGYDAKRGGPTYQIHWDTQFSSVLSVQSLIGFSHTGVEIIPVTNGVKNACGVDTLSQNVPSLRRDPFGRPVTPNPLDEDNCFQSLGALTSGSYYRDQSDDRIRYTVRSDASYFLENFLGISHTLKGGFEAAHKKYTRTSPIGPSRPSTRPYDPVRGGSDSTFEPAAARCIEPCSSGES